MTQIKYIDTTVLNIGLSATDIFILVALIWVILKFKTFLVQRVWFGSDFS